MQVRSLLDIDEIKNFQNILEDWQIVPLNVEINNCIPLLIRYEDEGIYEALKNDPIIETIPFFIGMEYNASMAKICYLFIKVYSNDNTGYTIHEVAFNLQNKKQVNDCKNILTTDKHGVILISDTDAVLINYDLADRITYANSLLMDELISIDFPVLDNYREAISSLQAYKSNPESLLLWLTEISKEQHSSLIHIKM